MSVPILNDGRPWWKVGHRVLGNPFASWGTGYCARCREECEVDTQAEHKGDTYAYKQTCCRCGAVVSFGAMRAPLISDVPLPRAALEWTQEPGRDRR